MIAKMNAFTSLSLPADGGVNAGNPVGPIDCVIIGGDIANRQEPPIQSASASWVQFTADYVDGLTLEGRNHLKTALLLIPGNHDVSNAIGYPRVMSPPTDSTSMVNIYALMMASRRPPGAYDYAREKIHYSRDIGGLHLMFVNMWPDSAERIWMTSDLAEVEARTPVILFAHDEPAVESKHFTNPNGVHDINPRDRFENLIPEAFKDGTGTVSDPSTIEQRGFAAFVKARPNIVAYFHGNDNENRFYVYAGPDSTIALDTFDVDSPMKGNISRSDESKLSFQLVSIDTDHLTMTVRECLWNQGPTIVFGASTTVSLAPGLMK